MRILSNDSQVEFVEPLTKDSHDLGRDIAQVGILESNEYEE